MNEIERQAPELRVQNGLAKMGKVSRRSNCQISGPAENLVCLPALVPRLPFAWVSDATKVACSVELKRRGVRSDPDRLRRNA